MTQQQKETIMRMRRDGVSYSKISLALGISENTVKSFCRRNQLDGANIRRDYSLCGQCGLPLIQTAGAKQKRFCSDKCRMAWWNAHPEAIDRKAIYTFTCTACGCEFESYGNKNRKYCSRKCYGQSRVMRDD